jgi:DNA-binding NtrC family response regulator
LQWVENAVEACDLLGMKNYDVIISDLEIYNSSIGKFIEESRKNSAHTMVIVTSTDNHAAEAIRTGVNGMVDILTKPYSAAELEYKVKKALELKQLRNELDSLRGERNIIYHPKNFIGESPSIKRVFELVRKVADSASTVLLTGETGTGKELVAGAIHYNSHRFKGPFVKVNCAALPEQLLESELFGHEKGAFTGADKTRIGRFEQACGGTIFLDEIGDMSLTTQAKLLRVLQEREFNRVGGMKTIKVDVRIIAATNKDLQYAMQQNQFREDLYYRLNVITIDIPPLRDRKGDVLLLTYFFLKKFCGDLKKKIKEIDPQAVKRLTDYSWPGNIRELENTIERAVLMAEGDIIRVEDLNLPGLNGINRLKRSGISVPADSINLEKMEKQVLLQALNRCDWVQKDAARLLGVSQRVLNYKIKRFSITHPKWKKFK